MGDSVRRATFLSCRPASILWRRPLPPPVNLEKFYDDDDKEGNKEKNYLQVYLRLKSGSLNGLYNYDEETLKCNVPTASHFTKSTRGEKKFQKHFKFSKIFGPESNQIGIFNEIIKQRIMGFIDGENSTILTYGTSGSGKTYTLIGNGNEPGLIPQSLEYLYKSLPHLPTHSSICIAKFEKDLVWTDFITEDGLDFSSQVNTFKDMQTRLSTESGATLEEFDSDLKIGIYISFAEIYNEQVHDLLQPNITTPQNLAIYTNNGNTYIKNLTYVYASTSTEAYKLLQFGLNKLNYATTSLNARSSRSHCIFSIKLLQHITSNDEIQSSTFNFCDLAGSERSKKTKNVGVRLKESNNINTSLMVLGKCISMIRNNQKKKEKMMIPYRESKLTQLFQKALEGGEDISMIVTINPDCDMFDENMRILQFSAIAKNIIIEENEEITKNPCSSSSSTSTSTLSAEEIALKEQKYLDAIAELSDLIEKKRMEKAEKQQELKDKFVKKFENCLKENRRKWLLRIEEDVAEMQREFVRTQHARLDSSVICLDDTVEDKEKVCKNCQNLDVKINALKEKLQNLEEIIEAKKKERRTEEIAEDIKPEIAL